MAGGRLGEWLRQTYGNALPPISPGRLLEIGCASGVFMAHMAAQGWNVSGIELSHHAARRAQQAGLNVYLGTVELALAPAQPFDLIVGWMVLEHLHEPIRVLRTLRAWIARTGWLVVSLPNADSADFHWFRRYWYALDLPRHLFHFTPRTLSRILAQSGWRIERVIHQHNPNNLFGSLGYLATRIGWEQLGDWLVGLHAQPGGGAWRLLLGKILGYTHASGRITVWARPEPWSHPC